MSAAPLILLTAGGTGGHLFPAESLAVALKARGARVALATDERVGALSAGFPAEEVVEIPSATPSVRSPIAIARAAVLLAYGVVRARSALARLKPAVVVGFGGYPTVPPVVAAGNRGIPTVLHEANGVMGRANRFLARRVTLIATGLAEVRGVPETAARRVHTGNPVRPAVIEAAAVPYPPLGEFSLQLLAVGGSQGARVMSDVVPPAVEHLDEARRRRLGVTQQARPEELERTRETYRRLGVEARVEPFFKDLPGLMARSHLVVSRSGASTVAELGAIGRPSILVPLPGAIDQDQAANAATLAFIGAASVIPQADFTPERLAREIAERLDDPQRLTRAAAAAKSAGILDAADRLAVEVMRLAG